MKQEIYSAIPMDRFGINTLAITQHEFLIEAREKFLNDPDWTWCEGRGKKYMHQILKENLLAEEAYFEAHIEEAIEGNQRWMNFIDDCVIYAVLDEVIKDDFLLLSFSSSINNVSH